MRRSNLHALPCCLLALLVLVGGRLSAEEARALPDQPPQAKKAKAKAKASEPAPGEFFIEWDRQKLGEPDIIKRLYRLRKSNQWEDSRLPRLVTMVIESKRPKLLPYGYYYKALIHGRNGEKEALESIKKAIELGYANYVEIAGAEELTSLHEMDEFRALIEPLAAAFQKKGRADFEEHVNATFAVSADGGGSRWAPDLKARPDGAPFWQGDVPVVAVITRADHEGFEKLYPRFEKIVEGAGERLAAGVVFYTEFPEDEARIARADVYARKVGLDKIRHAVAGRNEYKALVAALLALEEKAKETKGKGKEGSAAAEEEDKDETSARFQVAPLITAFLDGKGVLRHAACGVLEDWQLEYAARKLGESSPRAEAPVEEKKEKEEPKEEAPTPKEKETPKEEPPAGEPEKKKEEPAPEETPKAEPPAGGSANEEPPPEKASAPARKFDRP